MFPYLILQIQFPRIFNAGTYQINYGEENWEKKKIKKISLYIERGGFPRSIFKLDS